MATQKKKVLVLTKIQGKGQSMFVKYAPADMQVAVRALRSFFVAWDGRTLHIQNPTTGEALGDFDAVHLAAWRTDDQLSLVMSRWLKQQGISFVGATATATYPASKLGEMVFLTSVDIPYPKSFYASRTQDIPALIAWAKERFGLKAPFIMKSIDSMKGNNNFLVKDVKDIATLPLQAEKRYIVQEFIPNDYDYRFLVIGGEIQFVMQRTRAGNDTHLNNTSKGARLDFVDTATLPHDMRTAALKAAATLGREDIAGVDIMVNKETDEWYVLEVNRTPAIASGVSESVDIAKKVQALYSYIDALIEAKTRRE